MQNGEIPKMTQLVYERLSLFKRYRDTPTIAQESIAEHQYFVSLITKILCDKYGVPDDVKLRALEIALIHDCAESMSDDFTYSMKYENGADKFRDALEVVEEGIMHEIAENLHYNDLEERYNEYKGRETLPARIVKLADWYSVLLFCRTEISRGNNISIKKIYEGALARGIRFEKETEALFKLR